MSGLKFRQGDVIAWEAIYNPTYKLIINNMIMQSLNLPDSVVTTRGARDGPCDLYEIFSLSSPDVFADSYTRLYIAAEIDRR